MATSVTGRPTSIGVGGSAGAVWITPVNAVNSNDNHATVTLSSESDTPAISDTVAQGEAATRQREINIDVAAGELILVNLYIQYETRGDATAASIDFVEYGSTSELQQYVTLVDEYTQAHHKTAGRGIRAIVLAILQPSETGSNVPLTVRLDAPVNPNDFSITAHAIEHKGGVLDGSSFEAVSATHDSLTTNPTQLIINTPSKNARYIAGCFSTAEGDSAASTAGAGWTEIYDDTTRDYGAVAEHQQASSDAFETASWTFAEEVYAITWGLVIPTGQDTSKSLILTDFPEFRDLDTGETVDGIEVTIEGHVAGTDSDADFTQIYIYQGGVQGDNKAATPVALTTEASDPDATYTVGGSSDTWSASRTVANIASASFGLLLKVTGAGANDSIVRLDDVVMTVTLSSTGTEPNITLFKDTTGLPSGTTYDLGGFFKCEGRQCTLTIRNTGDATLTFGTTTIASGMTIISGPADTDTLAAGAETSLVIEPDASSCGALSSLLTINSDDPDTPAYTATLTAYITYRRFFDWRSMCPYRRYRTRCG